MSNQGEQNAFDLFIQKSVINKILLKRLTCKNVFYDQFEDELERK